MVENHRSVSKPGSNPNESQPSAPCQPAPLLGAWRSSPQRTLVFLHGFGGHPDSYDLESLRRGVGSTSVVRARGPVTTESGFGWWDGEDQDPSPDTLANAIAAVRDQLPQTTDPLVLVGFSQGGAAALEAGLLAAHGFVAPVAAVVAVAGFLVSPPDDIRNPPPVLFVHPTDDSVVDVFLAERATRLLTRHGVDASFVEVPGDHAWSNAIVDSVVKFLLHH